MLLRLTLAKIGDREVILRGSADRVQERIDLEKQSLVQVYERWEIEGEVLTEQDEALLWLKFIKAVHKLGFGRMALDKFEIWRRACYYFWVYSPNPGYLAMFLHEPQDFLIAIGPNEAPVKHFSNPTSN